MANPTAGDKTCCWALKPNLSHPRLWLLFGCQLWARPLQLTEVLGSKQMTQDWKLLVIMQFLTRLSGEIILCDLGNSGECSAENKGHLWYLLISSSHPTLINRMAVQPQQFWSARCSVSVTSSLIQALLCSCWTQRDLESYCGHLTGGRVAKCHAGELFSSHWTLHEYLCAFCQCVPGP